MATKRISKKAKKDVFITAKLRKRWGLTIEEFCKTFGLTIATVVKWEAGTTKPNKSSKIVLWMIEHDTQNLLGILRKMEGVRNNHSYQFQNLRTTP